MVFFYIYYDGEQELSGKKSLKMGISKISKIEISTFVGTIEWKIQGKFGQI